MAEITAAVPQPQQPRPGPGLIYDETREVRRWLCPSLKDSRMDPALQPDRFVFRYSDKGNGWKELTLICRGMRITALVNGLTRTDWDATGVLDSPAHARHDVGRRALFALRLHTGDGLKIRFKDIKVRTLHEKAPNALLVQGAFVGSSLLPMF